MYISLIFFLFYHYNYIMYHQSWNEKSQMIFYAPLPNLLSANMHTTKIYSLYIPFTFCLTTTSCCARTQSGIPKIYYMSDIPICWAKHVINIYYSIAFLYRILIYSDRGNMKCDIKKAMVIFIMYLHL